MEKTIKELRRKGILGPKEKESASSRSFGYFMIVLLLKPLIKLRFQAEHVCLLWIIMGSLSGVLFAFGNYWLGILAVVLYHLSFMLDNVDGAVARYRNRSTLRGHYLDLIGHTIVKSFIVIGIGIGVFFNPPSYLPFDGKIYLFAGLITTLMMVSCSVARLKSFETLIYSNNINKLKSKRSKFKTKNLKTYISEFLGIYPFSLFYWCALFNVLGIMILFYMVAFPFFVYLRISEEYKWLKCEMDKD